MRQVRLIHHGESAANAGEASLDHATGASATGKAPSDRVLTAPEDIKGRCASVEYRMGGASV